MISIRPIEEKDLPFMWNMLYEMVFISENKPPKEELFKVPEIRRCLEGWGRKGDTGFIAMSSQQEPIGVVWYRLCDESNKGYGFVDCETPELDIAILKEYVGKGVGTSLFKSIIKQAKTDGFKALSLSVDPNNHPALGLYEKFGFKKCGTSGTSWTMKLSL